MEGPKFEIGQKVKVIEASDNDAGVVVGINIRVEEGWVYQVTSREVDHAKKEIINGVMTCKESELVEVVEVVEEVKDEGEEQ